MEKIDRLGWAAGICFQSYGLKIGVRVNVPQALGRVKACLPPGWESFEGPIVEDLFSLRIGVNKPGSQVRNFHLLYVASGRAARTLNLDEVYDVLEGELQIYVGEWAQERVFVHAGVVGWKERAIVLPGRTHSGKSTLVEALLRAGATYYSDEYAVLDPGGMVHPYPRRLSLRQPNGQSPRRCTAEELGSSPGAEPLPIGLVAALRHQPGSRWDPRPLRSGQALMELMNNTLPAKVAPERVLDTLRQVAPRTETIKGLRGEAEETAELLLNHAGW